MKQALALLVVPALLLAGCNKAKDDDDRTASGEVLNGTIADSELPLDEVRSQPPLAKSQASPGSTEAADESESADDAAALDSAQPEIQSQVE